MAGPAPSPGPPRLDALHTLPPLPRAQDLAVRLAMALLFLAGLLALLGTFRPPVPGPQVRLQLPPALLDPARVLPLAPETARAANALVPVTAPAVAAAPFLFAGTAADRDRAADCLAAAQWYEAGDDPSGQRAVAQVVLNRARHPAFPATVCGVVFQGSDRKTGCQFTFTCDGALAARHPGPAAWARARAIALSALSGAVDPRVGLATHYHADYVVPYWRASLVKLAQVGAHLFYGWPGYWGTSAAMAPSPRAVAEPDESLLAGLLHKPDSPVLPFDAAGLSDDTDLALATPAAPRPAMAAPAPVTSAETIELALDPQAFPGSYAVRAYALCKDKPRCVVLGRHAGPASAALGFVYVRDARSGAEGTWWNCAATPRADRAQCLPEGPAADRLVARWL